VLGCAGWIGQGLPLQCQIGMSTALATMVSDIGRTVSYPIIRSAGAPNFRMQSIIFIPSTGRAVLEQSPSGDCTIGRSGCTNPPTAKCTSKLMIIVGMNRSGTAFLVEDMNERTQLHSKTHANGARVLVDVSFLMLRGWCIFR
jgi:hypothetical protein